MSATGIDAESWANGLVVNIFAFVSPRGPESEPDDNQQGFRSQSNKIMNEKDRSNRLKCLIAMTLDQLRIFVEVAERGHVTRGAQALSLSQSAASAAISALEASHHVKLFDRVGRGIQLTETGRLFLREARAVLDRAGMARSVLQDLAGYPA